MPTSKSPRKGSLQYWPRKRSNKFLPRVNWDAISEETSKTIQGFIGYKAGMMSCALIDNTPDSMTKGKEIVRPVTLILCPKQKIFSIRFYKNNKPISEILNTKLDKNLKKKLKIPKDYKKTSDSIKPEEYDDIRVIFYSDVKSTGIKKVPDFTEIGLKGSVEEKFNFVKENLAKEFSVTELFNEGQLIDVRGLTKGKGFSGPVKRFGIKLKFHKSEKGVRRPGNIGPWHPNRTNFRVPMAGQLGMFTRVHYNKKIIKMDNKEIKNLEHFGNMKGDYVVVEGSVQGSRKRQILLTAPMRETKKQKKKIYEFKELR
jgi:large subunit ribosomal protein L3